MSEAQTDSLDLSEKGLKDGKPISLDRRLFMKFTAFTGCSDDGAAAADALAAAGVEGTLYLDANDPEGIGLVVLSEDPEYFVTTLRTILNTAPFTVLKHKPEFDMLGRTYSIGYEPDLEDSLFVKPRSKTLNPDFPWAVWYPLQRAKSFQRLPEAKQRQILGEHGTPREALRVCRPRGRCAARLSWSRQARQRFHHRAIGARIFFLCRPSCRKCARPNRPRSISTASGRSLSAESPGRAPHRSRHGQRSDSRSRTTRLRRDTRRFVRRSGRTRRCHAVSRQRLERDQDSAAG